MEKRTQRKPSVKGKMSRMWKKVFISTFSVSINVKISKSFHVNLVFNLSNFLDSLTFCITCNHKSLFPLYLILSTPQTYKIAKIEDHQNLKLFELKIYCEQNLREIKFVIDSQNRLSIKNFQIFLRNKKNILFSVFSPTKYLIHIIDLKFE